MTTIIRTRISRPSTGFSAGAAYAAMVRAAGVVVETWTSRANKRRTTRALRELDDRLLRDIGLDRSELGPQPVLPALPIDGWR